MFTNWLTGTSGSHTITNSGATNEQLVRNNLPTTSQNILATPPDVVLEVGPTSETVRFMAHSLVLGMHSGYLRSAVRLDETATTATSSNLISVYLTNVTAEQFAPLLTYMYTGYLDLNVENIFGVLLATHVLHMPRALEICRAFLGRTQNNAYTSTALVPVPNLLASGAKIIRPIPSKPFGFLQTTATAATAVSTIEPTTSTIGEQLALHMNTFKTQEITSYENSERSQQETLIVENSCSSGSQNGEEIDVDRSSSRASDDKILPTTTIDNGVGDDDDDDEDEEVFIDSSSSSNITDIEVLPTTTTMINVKQTTTTTTTITNNATTITANIEAEVNKITAMSKNAQKMRRKSAKDKVSNKKRAVVVGGLQVAKAPIPASQLEPIEGNISKVIIDIASCDGPVRFRRILNTAYGHKPDAYVVPAASATERTQQSVSLSFQQQMARTIRQQTEETENKDGLGKSKMMTTTTTANNEIYVCVYCKHTFKSQYCYQKHAKRHLNPLSLNCARTATSSGGEELITDTKHNTNDGSPKTQVPLNRNNNNNNNSNSSSHNMNNKNVMTRNVLSGKMGGTTAAEMLLRREVRPLDMNVQYYPCKTCGSKFPSYYFVHKHRKLCHADEETGNGTVATTTTAAATTTTSTTTTSTETID